MKQDQKRGITPVAWLLLILLLVAIIGVTTILVGRALGWWTYADLPVIGRFFPAGLPDDEDPPDETQQPVDPVADLKAEIALLEAEIAQLETFLEQRDRQVSELTAQVDQLTVTLQQQTEAAVEEKWQETAKMLENMRPEQAASIVSHYEDEQIVMVLRCMSSEAAGGILSKLDPARAARVTVANR